MRALAIGVAAVGIAMVLEGLPDAGSTVRAADEAIAARIEIKAADALAVHRHPAAAELSDQALTQVVKGTCVVCHNDQMLTGNLSLQEFDVARAFESAASAERMITKLRAEMMPPPGMPRPGGDTLTVLVERLERKMDEASAANPQPGSRRFQRLNQDEYERAIKTLLALDVDAGDWLPAENYVGSFDTYSDAQGLSTTIVEAYLRAAADVSRAAVGDPTAAAASKTYPVPIEVSQHAWDQIEGAPFGTRGGIVTQHTFPADGEYVFSVETVIAVKGKSFEDIDVAVDGERVALLEVPHGRGVGNGVAGGANGSGLTTEPVFVSAGEHRVSAAFVRKMEGPYEDRLLTFGWSLVGGEDSDGWSSYGITALPHVRELTIAGPQKSKGVSDTPARRMVFTCRPSSRGEERPCAESIVKRLAGEAYRRPITAEDVAGLMAFYDKAAADRGFEIGVRTALQAILSHPSFVFRLEEEPDGMAPGGSYRLSDVTLASRLSFFLWGTLPDEQLLELAEAGRLGQPAILERQVKRMLADPRSEALATRFAAQWLRLQSLDGVQPQSNLYPDFNRQVAESLRRETELLFDHLVREDRSLLELFTADYTFVNQRLADFYGIAYTGDGGFERVRISDPNRQGVLGQGSVLTLTSLPNRTSPVLRGKWVMEVLLGTPPPPPPPNVPAFEASPDAAGGRRLTTRERIEAHAKSPVCNSCHRFIDPIGLALDNYDAIGRWRTRENMVSLDTRGTFYDGTPIATPKDLRDVMLKRPIPLVRNFTENLMAFAIGRPVEYQDKPSVRAIAENAKGNDYRLSSFILGVVKSDAFLKRQADGQQTAQAR